MLAIGSAKVSSPQQPRQTKNKRRSFTKIVKRIFKRHPTSEKKGTHTTKDELDVSTGLSSTVSSSRDDLESSANSLEDARILAKQFETLSLSLRDSKQHYTQPHLIKSCLRHSDSRSNLQEDKISRNTPPFIILEQANSSLEGRIVQLQKSLSEAIEMNDDLPYHQVVPPSQSVRHLQQKRRQCHYSQHHPLIAEEVDCDRHAAAPHDAEISYRRHHDIALQSRCDALRIQEKLLGEDHADITFSLQSMCKYIHSKHPNNSKVATYIFEKIAKTSCNISKERVQGIIEEYEQSREQQHHRHSPITTSASVSSSLSSGSQQTPSIGAF